MHHIPEVFLNKKRESLNISALQNFRVKTTGQAGPNLSSKDNAIS